MTKVEIVDDLEVAIIESFPNAEANLQRKKIIDIVHKKSGKNADVIGKRIEKLVKMKQFLIKKSKGIYSLNPEIDFGLANGRVSPETKTVEIPPDRREIHTLKLREAIESWITNFPSPPHLQNNYFVFLNKVKECETHLLFSDLCYHLSASGFDITEKWEKYKIDVLELEKFEKELKDYLSTMIRQITSEIFNGLELIFVGNYFSLESDYQCSLPRLILERALDEQIVYLNASIKGRNAKTDEEYEKISDYVSFSLSHLVHAEERIKEMLLIEKDDSLIWGEPENRSPHFQILRIPKKDKEAFMRAKDQAISLFVDPPLELRDRVSVLVKKLEQLDQERENMLVELKRSSYCECFSGDCRYLGA